MSGFHINTSPVKLEFVSSDIVQMVEEALGMVEFWEHHRQCVPLSAEGCTCGLWKIRAAVAAARGEG